MKEKLRLIYIALYVLFLTVLFVLFAVVHNTVPGIIPFYVFLFLTLALVTVLFYIAFKQYTSITETDNNEQVSNQDQQLADDIKEETTTKPEAGSEIEVILPTRITDVKKFTEEVLQNMAKAFSIVQGLFYIKNHNEDLYHCYAQYAYFSENKPQDFKVGDSLTGQAVKNKAIVSLNNIPEKYMTIASGLGKSDPKHLVFVPVKNQDEVIGLIEYATFEPLTEAQFKALEGMSKKVADTISKHLKK